MELLGLEPQLMGALSPTTLLGGFSAPILPPWSIALHSWRDLGCGGREGLRQGLVGSRSQGGSAAPHQCTQTRKSLGSAFVQTPR